MLDLNHSLLTNQQIRQVEQTAIQNLQIAGYQLMQQAGLAAFNSLQQFWPDCRSIVVFCGAGNNAGDGYVLARLALLKGWSVLVQSLINPIELKNDAQTAYQDYLRAGGVALDFTNTLKISADTVVIDALFGTGLNRKPTDSYVTAIEQINQSGCPVLAIDIPSGLDANSGASLGTTVIATVTVTFIALKTGLFTGFAANYTGKVILGDLQLPADAYAGIEPIAQLNQKSALKRRQRCGHKGQFGHVLCIGGNLGFSGAIRLAAEAALRTGAGLVSIATRQSHSGYLNAGRPELMCHGVETPDQLETLIDKASVILIGPGLGQDDWAQHMFDGIINCHKPCVVDADALNILAKHTLSKTNWLLTPHPGEAARLLNCSTHNIAVDRYAACKALQHRYGGISILKGAGSLITEGKTIFVNTTGNPGMASGGMGDVLGGIIAGLLAQGLSLLAASQLAVHVHGEAADRLAKKQGERGLLASDLIPMIRTCIQEL